MPGRPRPLRPRSPSVLRCQRVGRPARRYVVGGRDGVVLPAVSCRRCSRPTRDVSTANEPGPTPPAPSEARLYFRRRFSRPARGFKANLLVVGCRVWGAPYLVARRARHRTPSRPRRANPRGPAGRPSDGRSHEEGPPGVRAMEDRGGAGRGQCRSTLQKARPFFVAASAGRHEGPRQRPEDGIRRGGEPGSMPLNPKKARPSFVAATAGQCEGPRRMSGRWVARAPPNVCRPGAPSNIRAAPHSRGISPPYSATVSAGRRGAPRQMSVSPGPTPFGPK